MKLIPFSVEWWDDNWTLDICSIETDKWSGALFSIGQWQGIYQFDILWLRALIYTYLGK